jgi:hypothetical protein
LLEEDIWYGRMSSVFERENDNIRVLSLFSGCGGMDFELPQLVETSSLPTMS